MSINGPAQGPASLATGARIVQVGAGARSAGMLLTYRTRPVALSRDWTPYQRAREPGANAVHLGRFAQAASDCETTRCGLTPSNAAWGNSPAGGGSRQRARTPLRDSEFQRRGRNLRAGTGWDQHGHPGSRRVKGRNLRAGTGWDR